MSIYIYLFIILQDFFCVSHWMVLLCIYTWLPCGASPVRLTRLALVSRDCKQHGIETGAASIIKTTFIETITGDGFLKIYFHLGKKTLQEVFIEKMTVKIYKKRFFGGKK